VIIIQRYMYQGPWPFRGGPRPQVFNRVRQYVAFTYLKQLTSENGKSKNLFI
jgi:hypothetical protein